ncbi:MAG: MBL fold metallo-hydrolase [Candidatus Thorarchaeota archaeon]
MSEQLGGTNIYLLKIKDGFIQIDAGRKSSVEKYFQFLKKNNIEPNEIKLIIVNHAHSDHVGALKVIQEATKAKVLIQENDKESLIQGKNAAVEPVSITGRVLTSIMPKSMHYFDPVQPDIVIKDNFSLKEFGLNATIFHTPGHTKGTIAVLDENGNAFVGCNAQGPPLRFSPGLPASAIDINKVIESLEKLVAKGAKIFYVAHGKPIKRETIEKVLKKRKPNKEKE